MRFKCFRCFTRILLLALLIKGTLSLRNVYMVIPEAVERGKIAVIKCMYELENEDLYQVKWYRGEREFCRYAPKDVPPLKIFPLSGIEVDRDASDWEKVTIKAESYRANGKYSCEISADAPSFITARLQGTMYVVDLPKGYPKLRGMRIAYKPGMKLRAECVSSNSMPAANISFYVNDEPAHEKHVWHKVSGGNNGSLWTAYSTIQFVVQKHHFIEGKLRIRCLAVIYSIYVKSHEKVTTILDDRTTIPPEPVTNPRIFRFENDNKEYKLSESGTDALSSAENACNVLFKTTYFSVLVTYILLK